MDKHDLERLVREWRPSGEIGWHSPQSLMVGAFRWPETGAYEASFALNLTQATVQDPDFEGLNFWTRIGSDTAIPLSLVNELNQNTRFVRHSVFEDRNLDVMLDLAHNGSELTPYLFEKYYTIFSIAIGRLSESLQQ